MARVQIHGRPIGYSSSKTAVERKMWIGHRVRRMALVNFWNGSNGEMTSYDSPHSEIIHGVEQVVWPVITCCGKRIGLILDPDFGHADARSCELCEKSTDEPDLLLVEILPPMRRSAQMQLDPVVVRKNRRERGVSAADAF